MVGDDQNPLEVYSRRVALLAPVVLEIVAVEESPLYYGIDFVSSPPLLLETALNCCATTRVYHRYSQLLREKKRILYQNTQQRVRFWLEYDFHKILLRVSLVVPVAVLESAVAVALKTVVVVVALDVGLEVVDFYRSLAQSAQRHKG